MTPARGFSLIELLVAISLIAILIGILLPTLSLARDRGRSAACMGHLRNFGQVMAMYYHDYDDVFPVARHMPPPMLTGDADPPLTEALRHYLPLNRDRTNAVYRCPGDAAVFDLCGSSYNYAMFLFGGQKFEQIWLLSMLGLTPDKTAVMSDHDGGTFDLENPPGGQISVGFNHRERNFLFADGHVSRIRLDEW